MNKIFRWTIGDTSEIGISILERSIVKVKDIFKKYDFKFFVCLNSNSRRVEKICIRNKINLIKTSWDSLPLPKEIVPEHYDIRSPFGIPKGRQGSFWKLCPPRLDIGSYEIVCDNDIIFQKFPKEIELFLSSNSNLVTGEHVFCFGKYTKYISKPYNSGLYGFPPNYDFGENILKTWKKYNSMRPLLSRDEQGLVTLTLISKSFIEIPKEKTCFVFNEGEPDCVEYNLINENGFDCQIVSKIKHKKSKLDKDMIHFLGSNRMDSHFYWSKYKSKLIL
jgi:hypothetical protein